MPTLNFITKEQIEKAIIKDGEVEITQTQIKTLTRKELETMVEQCEKSIETYEIYLTREQEKRTAILTKLKELPVEEAIEDEKEIIK